MGETGLHEYVYQRELSLEWDAQIICTCKAHANSLYRPEHNLRLPGECKYRGNQGVANTGLKHPSLDPLLGDGLHRT